LRRGVSRSSLLCAVGIHSCCCHCISERHQEVENG
jgi:hypothetical protein